MIDAVSVAKIFTVLLGIWALGYGVGQSMAWVRRIRDIA